MHVTARLIRYIRLFHNKLYSTATKNRVNLAKRKLCITENQTKKKWRRCVLLLLLRRGRRRRSSALKIYKKHEKLLSESNNIINIIFIATLNLIAAGQKIQINKTSHTHTHKDTPTQRRFVTCASELCKLIIYCQNTNKTYRDGENKNMQQGHTHTHAYNNVRLLYTAAVCVCSVSVIHNKNCSKELHYKKRRL